MTDESYTPVQLDCQDLVIGSGAGGATTAMQLAESGRNVIVLEEGRHVETEAFRDGISNLMDLLFRDAGLTPIIGRPSIAFAEGKCLGGSTVINGALMWRTPNSVIARWQSQYGLPDLSVEALAPYFDMLERDLSISPQPEKNANRQSWLLEKGAASLGWETRLTPRAQINCQNTNRCPTGCPTGAKQSMLVSFIPRAVKAGATFICNAKAEKILMSGGRATGVQILHGDDNPKNISIRAERVFVCCGPIQTPFLLKRSGIKEHVGKTLGLHLNLKIVAQFSEDIDPVKGTIMSTQISEFADQGLYIGGSNFDPIYLALSLAPHGEDHVTQVMREWRSSAVFVAQLRASGTGRVRQIPFIDQANPAYQVTAEDIHRIKLSLLRAAEALFASGARRLFLPIAGSGPQYDLAACDRTIEALRDQKRLDLLSVHAMGSVPMGRALNDGGRVVGTENLYVNDASMLPDATGTNPQLTIMAMAMRNMDRILNA